MRFSPKLGVAVAYKVIQGRPAAMLKYAEQPERFPQESLNTIKARFVTRAKLGHNLCW
jgi:hypothetical protein